MGEGADGLEAKVKQHMGMAGGLPEDERGMPVIHWLGHLPSHLRRSIFMLLRGYEEEGRKGRAQGAANRRWAKQYWLDDPDGGER